MKLQRREIMRRIVHRHATQKADVIRDGVQVWHQIRDHHAGFTARREVGDGTQREELVRAHRNADRQILHTNPLAVGLGEARFVVKQVML